MGKIKNFKNFFVIRVRWNIMNRIIQQTFILFFLAFQVYMGYIAFTSNVVTPIDQWGFDILFLILYPIEGYGLLFIKFKDKPARNQKVSNERSSSDK